MIIASVGYIYNDPSLCLGELTSLLRTARKQPLLSSEGSNMKKLPFFSRPSSFLNMLNGDGLALD